MWAEIGSSSDSWVAKGAAGELRLRHRPEQYFEIIVEADVGKYQMEKLNGRFRGLCCVGNVR